MHSESDGHVILESSAAPSGVACQAATPPGSVEDQKYAGAAVDARDHGVHEPVPGASANASTARAADLLGKPDHIDMHHQRAGARNVVA
jgi:hypothetical protein